MHFCCDQLQSIALFDKADGCQKEKDLPPCHSHETPACCQNSSIVHDGDDFSAAAPNINVSPSFVIVVTQAFVMLDDINALSAFTKPAYHNYDPPLPVRDVTVSLHTFLI